MVGHEPFDLADGGWLIESAAPAAGLAERRTDAAADQDKGVGPAVHLDGFLVAPLSDQRQPGGHIHLGRAAVGAAGAHQRLAGPRRTVLVLDMRYVLVPEVAQGGEDGIWGRLAQAAERAGLDRLGDLLKGRQVLDPALAMDNAAQDLMKLLCAFTAERAFPARLVHREAQEEPGNIHHARLIVHHHHAAGTHDGPGLGHAFVGDGQIVERSGQAASGWSSRLDCLHAPAPGPSASDLFDELA
jgi:hypothetical protein